MSEETIPYVTLKDWADGWVTAPEDTIVDGGPSSLWGAPDLCSKCGAYWECEHRHTHVVVISAYPTGDQIELKVHYRAPSVVAISSETP